MTWANSYGSSLKISFLNTYNFFDWTPDKNHRDWTFLPKNSPYKKNCKDIKNKFYRAICLQKDWNKKKYFLKLQKVSRIIFHLNADIIGLVELENNRVLKDLAHWTGYDFYYAARGNDPRGIRPGIMIKRNKNILGLKFHRISLISSKRSLLKAEVSLVKSKKIIIYVTHWPSQRHSIKKRKEVAKEITQILKKEKSPFLIMGDFNLVKGEEEKLLWPWRRLGNLVPTYFFKPKMLWHQFDRFYGKKLNPISGSYLVNRPKFLLSVCEYNKKKEPYYGTRVVGVPNKSYSDHFPISIKLSIN